MNLFELQTEYHQIKKSVPSYRLGQHFCNRLNLFDTLVDGKDLFLVEDDKEAFSLILEMCNDYNWDTTNDLPVFEEE